MKQRVWQTGVSRTGTYAVLALALCASILFAGCTSSGSSDPAIGRQISGNQALVLSLLNSADLDQLYLPYNGAQAPGAAPGSAPVGSTTASATGTVQVGEINLLLHNVGGAATAGGLFISGYDPHLIVIREKLGENPINAQGSDRSCVHNVIINSAGGHDVMVYCQKTDGISVGGRTTSGPNGDSTTISIGNIPLDAMLNQVVGDVTGQNVDWFTKNGVFGNARVDCTVQNGGQACRLVFGSPNANPNRALYGFLLLNMLYDEISSCANNCRLFPPRFTTGQVLVGVSDLYPGGDSVYMNYDILVNRAAWPPLLNEMPQRLQITACYYYTTTITPTVCVDPDPSTRNNDPCDASLPLVWKGSQGAPIQVSQIQPRSVPGGTFFDITLKHVGNGAFWRPGSLDQCGPYSPGRPDPARQNVVQLLDARVAGDLVPLYCSPRDGDDTVVVHFENGVGHLSCYYPLAMTPVQSRQAYQTPLTLEFGYLYQNVITKDVVIHRT